MLVLTVSFVCPVKLSVAARLDDIWAEGAGLPLFMCFKQGGLWHGPGSDVECKSLF